jgi:hypothetical protein
MSIFTRAISVFVLSGFLLCCSTTEMDEQQPEVEGARQSNDEIIERYFPVSDESPEVLEARIREFLGDNDVEIKSLGKPRIVESSFATFREFSPIYIVRSGDSLFADNLLNGGNISKFSLAGNYLEEWNLEGVRDIQGYWNALIPDHEGSILLVTSDEMSDFNSVSVPNVGQLINGLRIGEQYYFVNYAGELADLSLRFLIFDKDLNFLHGFANFEEPLNHDRMSGKFKITNDSEYIYAVEELATRRYRIDLKDGTVENFHWQSPALLELEKKNYETLTSKRITPGKGKKFAPVSTDLNSVGDYLTIATSVDKQVPIILVLEKSFNLKCVYYFNTKTSANRINIIADHTIVQSDDSTTLFLTLSSNGIPKHGVNASSGSLLAFDINLNNME